MKKDSNKTDIRILKYEDYVKKNPQKAYGYYCLGRLYLALGKYKNAQEYFEKALSIDSKYTVAKVGLIEANVFRRKFVKAVYLFSKYRQDINRKNIFRIRLIRGVSAFYIKDKLFSQKNKGLFTILFIKYTMHSVMSLIRKESDNIVLKLFLSMYYLSTNERSLDILNIFKTCVYMEGLDDKMRWELLEAIADSGEKLYYDINIASRFTSIPDPNCSDEYVNTIFGAALLKGEKTKIKSIYTSINKSDKKMTPSMLWRYVYWSREIGMYDLSVYECCRRLLKVGWVDKLIIETMIRLEKQNIISFTADELRVLRLYS